MLLLWNRTLVGVGSPRVTLFSSVSQSWIINNTDTDHLFRWSVQLLTKCLWSSFIYLLDSSPHTRHCPIRFLARVGPPPQDALPACTETQGSWTAGRTPLETELPRLRAEQCRHPPRGSPWVPRFPPPLLECTLQPFSSTKKTSGSNQNNAKVSS